MNRAGASWWQRLTRQLWRKPTQRNERRQRGARPGLELLEDRVVPAYLALVSAPVGTTSGWAEVDITTSSNPQARTLSWEIDAGAIAPSGAAPGTQNTGSFSANGDLVVRVVPEPGDTLGAPCVVFLHWEQEYFYDTDPSRNVFSSAKRAVTNGFDVTAEIVGVGVLPESPGGRGPFNQHKGHVPRNEFDTSWDTAGTLSFPHFGDGAFRGAIGATFALRIAGSGYSEGIWVNTDAHGEAGFAARFDFQLSTAQPDLRGQATQSRAALDWNAAGELELNYRADGVPLPRPTEVEFYWATTNANGGIVTVGQPFAVRTLNTSVFNPPPLRIDSSLLQNPPDGAGFLVAVLDPGNRVHELNEQNNRVVLENFTDLVAHGFYYEADGDALLEYTVEGRPTNGGVVAFYWATGSSFSDIIDPNTPIHTTALETSAGSHHVTIARDLLADRPSAATHLFAYLDSTDRVDELSEFSNNTATLKGADLTANTLYFNQNRFQNQRGVVVDYTLENLDPTETVEVDYYWATGTTLSTIISRAGQGVLPNGNASFGRYRGQENEPARWGVPPSATTNIIVVIDPNNKIQETNEANNTFALELHSAAYLIGSPTAIAARMSGERIDIDFLPGRGSGNQVSISEAEIRFGVDHFNWYQQIVKVPDHWSLFHLLYIPGQEQAVLAQPRLLPWTDPADYGANVNEYTITSSEAGRAERLQNLAIDDAPFYWDEGKEVRDHTLTNKILFDDSPRFPADFYAEPTDEVSFETQLVGVGYNGEMLQLPGARTIRWRTNASYDPNGPYQGGILLKVSSDRPGLPPIVAGGVIAATTSDAPYFTDISADSGTPHDQFTSDNRLVLHGAARPGVTVTLARVGVGNLGQVVSNANGFWTFDYTATALPNGVHTFTATDNQGRVSHPFTVEVDTAPPVAVTLVSNVVPENLLAETLVGFLDTGDLRGRLFDYRLVAGAGADDNAAFVIRGEQLLLAAPLDFETQATYSVRVRAENLAGAGVETVLTIHVSDVYEGPTDLELSSPTVEEDRPIGTVVGTFSATGAGTIRYFLVAGEGDDANGHFAVIDGQLIVSQPLRLADGATRSIRVQSIDTSDIPSEAVLAITVTRSSTANPPHATNAATRPNVQTRAGLVLTPNEADGNAVTHFRIAAITGGSLFLNNGTTQINNGDFISAAQGAAGLRFTPAAGFVGTASFEVRAALDAVGTGLSSGVTATIAVVANQPPMIGKATAGQKVKDTGTLLPFAVLTIRDADQPPQALTVTVQVSSAANGGFTAASLSASGFTSQGDGVYQFQGTATAAQTAIRKLVFAPTRDQVSPGQSVTTTFTVAVSDGLDETANGQTTVLAKSVNDAPVQPGGGIALPGVSQAETNPDGVAVSLLLTGATDVDGLSPLGIAVVGAAGKGRWQYSTDGGSTWLNLGAVSSTSARLLRDTDQVRFVPRATFSGTATLTYRAWDRTKGTPGGRATISPSGGTTPFSRVARQATILVADD